MSAASARPLPFLPPYALGQFAAIPRCQMTVSRVLIPPEARSLIHSHVKLLQYAAS